MMKQKLSFLLLSVTLSALAGTIDTSCPQHAIYGAATGAAVNQELCRTGYAVGYSYHYKNPAYSVTRLTNTSVKGTIKRVDSFKEDTSIPVEHRAHLADYKGMPYDRGHMTPAGDMSWNYNAMIESFYLSNMVPQNPSLNRGAWRQLETTVREWATIHKDIYVYTGPVFTNNYTSIGGVAVPQELFKIVYDPAKNMAIAFIIPNSDITVMDIPDYIVSIEEVERLTGLDFFPKLPYNKISVKQQVSTIEAWSKK